MISTDTNNNGEVLQQVELRKISNSDCNTWLHEIFGTKDEITSNMMCAGYKEGKKDACQVGSSGSSNEIVGLLKSCTQKLE